MEKIVGDIENFIDNTPVDTKHKGVIGKLTKEQKDAIPGFVKKWVNFSINLTDRGKPAGDPGPLGSGAQASMDWLYGEAKLRTPTYVLEMGSPYGMELAANLIQKLPLKAMKKAKLTSFRIDKEVEDVCSLVKPIVTKLIKDPELRRDNLKEYLRQELEPKLGTEPLPEFLTSCISDMVLGYVATAKIGIGHDAAWAAYYDFYLHCGGEPIPSNDLRMTLVKSGIWDCIILADVALVCPRPSHVYMNSKNQLHNPVGPALAWADGYKLYFLNNKNVKPEEVNIMAASK